MKQRVSLLGTLSLERYEWGELVCAKMKGVVRVYFSVVSDNL